MDKIRKIAYELYKQKWIEEHTTSEERLKNIRAWGKVEAFIGEIDSEDVITPYAKYRDELGYEGNIYACYEEFIEAEYRDIEYMVQLLDEDLLINDYMLDIYNPINPIEEFSNEAYIIKIPRSMANEIGAYYTDSVAPVIKVDTNGISKGVAVCDGQICSFEKINFE